jgi:hypothetical protein
MTTDNGVLSASGRSGCGSRKEEESRRRRVHNPGALHPQSGLQSLRRTGALVPTTTKKPTVQSSMIRVVVLLRRPIPGPN